MERVEKTVFISYRRTNFFPALSIFQDLEHHGYDVFIDYTGIASGQFESIILENIKARAHFLVLLTPTSLERCSDPDDWLRREIEAALHHQRNIVPLLLEGFDFNTPSIASQLTGKIAELKRYNGLEIVPRYFNAGMELLRDKYLNVPLAAAPVLHASSLAAQNAAKEQKKAAIAAVDRTKFNGMDLVVIQAGQFQKGSAVIQISQPFYLGKYPVTQAQWEAVMGNNPSAFKGDDNRPVEMVSWEDVQRFIRDLNAQEGGEVYSLPTEDEWEYACRAGSTTTYCFGDNERRLGEYAWYKENADELTHPVGKLKPNAWGIYDMHGNVWEWVQDLYDDGVDRVNRGGCWRFDANGCGSAVRGHLTPDSRRCDTGFRLLRRAP